MDQYKEFCRLRDYRKPGVEVPHHTEAEAFALATSRDTARELSDLARRHEHVLDNVISMAEEFGARSRPNAGGHAFRNFSVIVRALKEEHTRVVLASAPVQSVTVQALNSRTNHSIVTELPWDYAT